MLRFWFPTVGVPTPPALKQFKSLGFNIPYEFNESDFSICHDLIIVFLDEYPEHTPFDAICYLVAEANYGGRVTDEWDRRLVNVYMRQFVCEGAVEESTYYLSSLKEYYIPPDGDLASYKDFVLSLPKSDHPEAFGQHPNADIASLIEDTGNLLSTLISLQPRAAAAGGEGGAAAALLRQAGELLEVVPPPLDAKRAADIIATRTDPDPLKTVLLQELDRYNCLLEKVRGDLATVQRAVQGLVIVTPDLEAAMDALTAFRVPAAWGFCYPSVKPLAAWIRDLGVRVAQMERWAFEGPPKCFWLPGLTYPTGFLTALLQTAARRNGIAIDTLSWEFIVTGVGGGSGDGVMAAAPKEGALCDGLFLEGAKWNKLEGCLVEPEPMQLYHEMPPIHFRPVEAKKKASRGVYVCPMYMYPVRTGTRERPSFVIAAELKAGKASPEFWTKRGVALLLSTAA